MHLRLNTIDIKEVENFGPDYKIFFDKGWDQRCGSFVSKVVSNLGANLCHAPYISHINAYGVIPRDKEIKFVTGYKDSEFMDKILFDTEGPYKKLYQLSDNLVRVTSNGSTKSLLLPDEWFYELDFQTLLYSFLIQTREPIEHDYCIEVAEMFEENGFDVYESYLLSHCFFKDFTKGRGWGGVHQIFSGGVNLTKYSTGDFELRYEMYYTSRIWKGNTNPRNIVIPYKQGSFGKKSEIAVSNEEAFKIIRQYLNKMKSKEVENEEKI